MGKWVTSFFLSADQAKRASCTYSFPGVETIEPGNDIRIVGVQGRYRFKVFVNWMRCRKIGIIELLEETFNDSVF